MKKQIIIVVTALLMFTIVFGILVYNGIIIPNDLTVKRYVVKGVDVSSYQGKIDWDVLASQDISFAFIKATEGSSYVDKNFAYNYAQVQKTPLAVGAYHFFSFDSSGKTQAEHFIKTVTPFEGMLPPVIDLEFYGDKEDNPPTREEVDSHLQIMLDLLEKHYRLKPIIYATEKSYDLYLSNDYEEYDIWIRNVITKPRLSDNREWQFWQYTNRERLEGYSGKEKYIDVNVFNGTIDEFNTYPRYE